MSAKSEAADVAEKLASNLVKQGGKKVGSLVKSIFGSGSKKADDVAKVATKTGSKKTDDFVKSRPKTSRKVERSRLLDPTDKNYVIDKRLAVSDEGLPLYNTQTGQRISVRDPKTGRMTQQAPAAGDAGLGRVPVGEWNRIQNAETVIRSQARNAARKAAGPGRVRTTFDVSRARFPKATYAAIPLTVGGAAIAGVKGFGALTKDDGLSQDEWKTALGITEAPGTTDTVAKDPNQVYYDRAREIAKADYLASVLNYPGAEALDPQSTLSRQYADSTAAAMNALAQQYEQAAGGISQRGQTGASAINDIYAQGAGVTDALAAAPSDGMSGMIPVSGDAALAGQYSLAQGQSLADYLGASQAIDAQAANELAGYTKLLGPAYQSQYNLINQQYRNQADQQKSMRDFDSQIRRDEKLRDALSTIAMQEAEDARTATRYQPNPIEAAQYLIEWEGLDDNEKNAFKAAGVDTRAKYIEWRRNQKQQADLGL
jgi:hypothetical protein